MSDSQSRQRGRLEPAAPPSCPSPSPSESLPVDTVYQASPRVWPSRLVRPVSLIPLWTSRRRLAKVGRRREQLQRVDFSAGRWCACMCLRRAVLGEREGPPADKTRESTPTREATPTRLRSLPRARRLLPQRRPSSPRATYPRRRTALIRPLGLADQRGGRASRAGSGRPTGKGRGTPLEEARRAPAARRRTHTSPA